MKMPFYLFFLLITFDSINNKATNITKTLLIRFTMA